MAINSDSDKLREFLLAKIAKRNRSTQNIVQSLHRGMLIVNLVKPDLLIRHDKIARYV
jgi:hypothetical protein